MAGWTDDELDRIDAQDELQIAAAAATARCATR